MDEYQKAAYWVVCPMCDQPKCVDHINCQEIKEWAEKKRERSTVTMAEYIEREALMVALCKEIVGDGDYYNGKDDMQDQIRDMVSRFPAADVAPVRHGRWNADETCSCCGKKSTEGLDAEKWNYWFPDFCPNCGAKMDGGDR